MLKLILQLAISLVLVLTGSLEHTYYVKPDNLSPTCPDVQSCLTLDQYVAQQSKFFTTNSTFIFLLGNHSTRTTIHLRNVSDIILKGIDSALCKTDMALQCEHVTDLTIQRMTISFTGSNGEQSSALSITNSKDVLILNTSFQGGSDHDIHLSRAVSFNHSNATIENSTFRGNTGYDGGAIYISDGSNITMNGNLFVGNHAEHNGGAICAIQSELRVNERTSFINNSAAIAGGMFCQQGKLIVSNGNIFLGNHAEVIGGAIFAAESEVLVNKKASFIKNSAAEAGGMFCQQCKLTVSSASFVNNSASHAGGAIVTNQVDATYYNITVTGNSGSAVFIYRSNVTFVGNTTMNENSGESIGGAITAEASSVSFAGHTLFQDNSAVIEGGAIAGIVQTKLSFSGVTDFINNKAETEGGGAILGSIHMELIISGSVLFKNNNCTTCYGGAISLTGKSSITIFNIVTFESNWGEMGGAIYLRDSNVVLKKNATLVTSRNHARYYGGAIFHMDYIDYYQCDFSISATYQWGSILFSLPDCFLELDGFEFTESSNSPSYEIHSYDDSAGIDGQFLYGGLMDKCHVTDKHERTIQYDLLYNVVMYYHILHIEPNNTNFNVISSEAYTLCFCVNDREYDCLGDRSLSTYRGSKFSVSVLALSQGNNTITAPMLLAKVSKTGRLGLNQNSKNLTANCTIVSYNMFSTEEIEVLKLYPNKSCRDTGLAVAVIEVTFLHCPIGFTKSGDQCICEERLRNYEVNCTVYDEENYITRKAGAKFWLGYTNASDQTGLILYPSCPIDYCKTEEVNISLSQLDVQCDFNHSGPLCGACAANYSLILGNSRCQKCSNMYLLFLVVFAVAGILLVAFLSVLRLTVATGMVNSIILYANIVQANRSIFFPANSMNVLTVFIAWMNLDLGFPTCFYHGMDAYAHTWLQIVFPIYIWVLLSLIIVASRYSSIMTRLIGSNPIAVLATLLLLSYTKLLKTIIQVYSSVQLEYPNTTVTVWLKDAQEPYLKHRHLLLAVLSSIFIAFFFLPYTFFLLLGYKLYRYSGKRCIRWFMIRMKPLLDAYYAPYERHTRYWTGLLLLVRCALYIVFSVDSIGGTDNSLLAIIMALTVLIVIAWLSVKIYTSFYVNAIEALVYLNLITLSAAASNKANSPALVYSLVGIVFVIMVGIIVHHFHILYIAKSAVWLKITSKLAYFTEAWRKLRGVDEAERAPLVTHSKSGVNLREPLIEDSDY